MAAENKIIQFPVIPGFEMTLPPPVRRMILAAWGLDKTGKTSLGLSFPAPRVYMCLDNGLKELLLKRPELIGQIQHKSYGLTEKHDPDTWGPLLDQFEKDYIRAVDYVDKHSGTLIVDTAAELWSIVGSLLVDRVKAERLAKVESREYSSDDQRERALERADKSNRLDWGDANAYMSGLLRRVANTENASALFLNRAREVYNDKGAATGTYQFAGFNGTSAIVQAVVQLYKHNKRYYGLIEKCRFDGSIEGTSIENPDFETLAGLILGGWEDE